MNTLQAANLMDIRILGEQIYSLAQNMEFFELKKKLPEYTQLLEKQFSSIKRSDLTENDILELEQLFFQHEKLVYFLTNKKKQIKSELKSIRVGKEMQEAYPRHF